MSLFDDLLPIFMGLELAGGRNHERRVCNHHFKIGVGCKIQISLISTPKSNLKSDPKSNPKSNPEFNPISKPEGMTKS